MPRAKRSAHLFRSLVAAAAVAATSVATLSFTAAPAQADDLPPDPETVTTDVLPTWQINGVVWSQVVVGNTVYVTGSFTKARPPGVAVGGAGEIDANNIFAYDITTGNRVPFSHSLNAQGLVIRANPSGTRIYVGGDFTEVDGQVRQHVAAFDTATGNLVPGFAPRTDGQVRGFAFAGDTVYVGGNFRSANGQPRDLLAAFNANNGAMNSWAPSVDGGYVWSMVISPDNSRVIASGSFTTINGVAAYGMGAVSASTGATEEWQANTRLRSAGNDGAISSLSTDGTQVYGTGYAFGAGAQFEGTFAADPSNGAIKWVNDCLGDTYDIFPRGGVAYNVSHKHDCTVIGGFPDTSPRSRWQKASAERTYPIGTITKKDAYGWDFTGLPYSGQLHWYPDLDFGTYTSSRQAAWTVSGNDDYVVLGGEFPKVNGVAQQGLVRFGKRSVSPHAMKPIISAAFTPAPYSNEAGVVRVPFSSVWDRDDTTITYDVFRSPSTKIATFTRNDSEFWKLPSLSITDSGQTPGASVRYQVRAKDSDGNIQWSAWSPYVTVSAAAPAGYAKAVRDSGATHYWRLNQPTGTSLWDEIGDAPGTNVSVTQGAEGAVPGDLAITSPGGSTAKVTTKDQLASDAEQTVEAWVKTTSTRGGRIVGFGDGSTGSSTSGNTDRVLYLDNSGRPNFAVNNGAYKTIFGRSAINDGQWHHVAGTVDGNGLQLFVDGIRVGRDQATNNPKAYPGYWRIGADQTTGFTNRPTDAGLAGSIDDVAVYPKALSVEDLRNHVTASGRTGTWGTTPADTYGSKVATDKPDLYWRLGETSGAAVDSSANGNPGTVNGTVLRNQSGAVADNTAATFDGASGQVVSQQTWTAPTRYSAELWFKTTSTRGGKLIGFGNTASGLSSSYDRHIWMYSNGKVAFGATSQATSLVSAGSFNDGQWHHAVATQGPDGMRLWIDTQLVGSNTQTTAGNYVGYWKVGGDRTWGNTNSNFIAGTLDEVAVYPGVLSEQQVRDHYTASGRNAVNRPPVAAFTTTVAKLKLSVDGSTSTDPDGAIPTYAWEFGDGQTATGVTAQHTYAAAGDYTVKLTVTDGAGVTNSITKPVTVVANQVPGAAFTPTVDHLKVDVDAAESSDADGTLETYAWEFGDGETGTGKTATHTYAAAGSYDVKLTVTDNDGATATVTHQVTATEPPNALPTAAFGTETDELKLEVDASDSADEDGTISSYEWNFGDGETATGKTAEHTYAEDGTYTVELKVTDNRGGVGTKSHEVTVAANKGPKAAFDSTVTDLSAAFDAKDSDDPDGTVEDYAWDFGDGHDGSGKTAQHTYDAAGTYDVKLTVTDNKGAKDSVTKQVTVTAPVVWATDDFDRSVSGGWGKADKGGDWTIGTGASKFAVANGKGTATLSAGNGYTASLKDVNSADTELKFQVSMDKAATGGGQYVSAIGRQNSGGDYRAKFRVASTGAVSVWLVKTVNGTETVLTSTTVPGLTYSAGDTLNVRFQVVGTGSTSLKVKTWKTGNSEPTSWLLTTTDSTASLQQAGSVGIYSFLTSSTTNGPVVLAYDKVWAGKSE